MPRSFKTILACVFLVSFLALGIGAAPAQAHTTYMFYAEQYDRDYVCGDISFSLRYVDANDNGRLSIDEIVPGSFSNDVWYYLPDYAGGGPGGTWQHVTGVTRMAGNPNPYYFPVWILDGPGPPGEFLWFFSTADGKGAVMDYRAYSYSQTEVVPLPPSVFLLGAGLLGLAGWGRLKKS
jgi:hypothetical protein